MKKLHSFCSQTLLNPFPWIAILYNKSEQKSAKTRKILAPRSKILGQLIFHLFHQKLASVWKKIFIFVVCERPPCLLLRTFSSLLLSVIKAVALQAFAGWLVAGVLSFLLFRGPWFWSLQLWSISASRKPKFPQNQFCDVFVQGHPDSSEASLLICCLLTCPKPRCLVCHHW